MNTSRKKHGPKPVSLVTGAAGFIGTHVAAELLAHGHQVIGLDNLSSGFIENVPPGVAFVEGSITDSELVASLFRKHRIEFVFHLAAYAAEAFSHFVRSHTYHHNVLGSAHLINAAAQSGTVRCFVFTSSVAVYGDQPGPWSEDTAADPLDPYGISKHAIELDLRSAFAMFGLPYIIFRPHNVYGEGQNLADPHRNVIGIFMRHILEGKELPIFGDGSQTRAFTYIADIAPLIAASVDHPNLFNGVFNIGSDRSCAVLDLAQKVGEAMGVQPRLKFLPARPEAAQTYSVHARLRKHFGNFPPAVELEIGLRKMAAWARRIGVRRAPCSPPVEAGAHLPEYWRASDAPALDPAEKMNGVLRSLKQNAVAHSVRVS